MCPWLLQKEEAADTAVRQSLKTLETYLSSRTFLIGERVTLADIVGVCNLLNGFTNVGCRGS